MQAMALPGGAEHHRITRTAFTGRAEMKPLLAAVVLGAAAAASSPQAAMVQEGRR
jgi:hypothetical protein